MAIVRIMGILDLVALIVMLLLHYGFGSWRIGVAFAMYLLFKAVAFFGNIHSFIDGAIGVYIVFLVLGFNSIITFVACAYLLQKSVVSLMS